jgi:hypothetical protein
MVAMLDKFPRDKAPDAEFWVVNYSFKHQENPDRVYFFDNPFTTDKQRADFHEEWVENLNALEGCRIITRQHYDEIPASEAYPLDDVIRFFGGHQYFTCTIAYMIAHAIYEGVDKISLVGMYHPTDSMEYLHHIACVNWWTAYALGSREVDIEVVGNTMIGKPYPWQPRCYGYMRQRNEILANQTMSAAYRASIGYPICFTDPDNVPFDAQGQMDAVLSVMPDGRASLELVDVEE